MDLADTSPSSESSKAYEEVVDFIAAGATPQDVIAFRPSDSTRRRVWELVEHEKNHELTPEEAAELEHYSQLEHIMRLAKARARRHLSKAS